MKGHKGERALYGLTGRSFVTLQKTLFLGNIPDAYYQSLAGCTPLFQKKCENTAEYNGIQSEEKVA